MDSARWIRVGVTVSSAMFGASLFGMTLLNDSGGTFLIGFACLLFGWGEHLAWYANPLLFFSLLLLLRGRYSWASVSALFALALATTTFGIRETLLNEAGTKAPVVGYGWGFYLWFGSILVMLGTAVGCWIADPRAAGSQRPLQAADLSNRKAEQTSDPS